MIDLTKLTNVVQRDGKVIARCPACASVGRDNTGNHLVIFPDGRFGCVCHPGDREHNRAIWRAVGSPEKPRPIPLRKC